MNAEFEQFLIVIVAIGLGLSPIVNMLLQALKPTGLVPENWYNLVAIIIGMLLGLVISLFAPQFGEVLPFVIGGAISGGVAVGIYKKIVGDTYKKIEGE